MIRMINQLAGACLLVGALLASASLSVKAAAAGADDRLPDGIVTTGQRDITAVWLTGPSDIYAHGVLGDAIEATGLRVKMADGGSLSFHLDGASVFEDRRARLADLDGDGGDEILVVRSYLDRGAALAIFRVREIRITWVAETTPIGRAHRWLNPLGIADFDGDGRLEIALVITPHIGGTLKIFHLANDALVEDWSAKGFSNHIMGSRHLDLGLIVKGGAKPALLLPNARRTGLRLVSHRRGGYQVGEIEVGLGAAITHLQIKRDDLRGNVTVTYIKEDGGSGAVDLHLE